MLDDLKMIHQRDSRDLLGAIEKQAAQLASQIPPSFVWRQTDDEAGELNRGSRSLSNVVCVGVDEAFPGIAIARDWLAADVPFDIVSAVASGYRLPAYANEATLCIIVDYSSSEHIADDTVDVLRQAQAKGARIVFISAGDRLHKLADIAKDPLITYIDLIDLPLGFGLPAVGAANLLPLPPSTWQIVKVMAAVCDMAGLAKAQAKGKASELAESGAWFAEQAARWRPDVATARNDAKRIALELAGKSVVIYSGPQFGAAAASWKQSLNRYAKQLAWTGQYSNDCYDEFLGWTRQPVHKPYGVVELRSNLESTSIQKQFELAERLLSGMRPASIPVQLQGNTWLQQTIYATILGDFVAVYTALLGGIDPSSGEIVSKIGKAL